MIEHTINDDKGGVIDIYQGEDVFLGVVKRIITLFTGM